MNPTDTSLELWDSINATVTEMKGSIWKTVEAGIVSASRICVDGRVEPWSGSGVSNAYSVYVGTYGERYLISQPLDGNSVMLW